MGGALKSDYYFFFVGVSSRISLSKRKSKLPEGSGTKRKRREKALQGKRGKDKSTSLAGFFFFGKVEVLSTTGYLQKKRKKCPYLSQKRVLPEGFGGEKKKTA